MSYWPWWAGGLALAGVSVLHFFATNRMMAVSGRFTTLVNRVRFSPPKRTRPMSEAELLAALAAATADEFGPDVCSTRPTPDLSSESSAHHTKASLSLAETPSSTHVLFFASLAVGGLLAALSGGTFRPTLTLNSQEFSVAFHHNALLEGLALLIGGVCVGFGTRMAGGCTSGHGLCGVSRLQPGSLLATAAFFGAGIATALSLDFWR